MPKYFILLLLLSSALSAFGQKEVDFDSEPSFLDRVYFGGGLGFASDSRATYISVSPIVGYMITPNLSAGVGIQYQYIKDKYFETSGNSYGGSLFTRYNIKQFFLQTEYNVINVEVFTSNDFSNRMNYDRFLFGGGISQPLGKRASLNIVGMYDVLYDVNSPFASPWVFRVYVSI